MKPVGLQLYTLRRPFGEDPVGTLERIKQTGYDEVEFAAPLDMDFAPLAARMREIDLDCPSVHVGLAEITERPARVFEVARTLGCRFIVLPYVDPKEADWRAVVGQLDAFAGRARDEGFRFAYHHHHFEFDNSRGFRPFDVLVGESDPALVFFELDVFWLKTGGEEPKAMIEKLGSRVKLLHLKDMTAEGNMTDVGAGVLDFPGMVAAGRAVGVEHFFVEHDVPPKPYWPSVEASARYLGALA
ncbi:MAG: sugar phosphate isomerase/epimerase [Caulobacteraceae bacterium]|nr:sugar phosphate isomerase/epimerase [Caulobacteraceae bacterium]